MNEFAGPHRDGQTMRGHGGEWGSALRRFARRLDEGGERQCMKSSGRVPFPEAEEYSQPAKYGIKPSEVRYLTAEGEGQGMYGKSLLED